MAAVRHTLRRYRTYLAYGLRTFLLRKVRPYLFILVINDQCNLDCFYCMSKNTGQFDLDRESVEGVLAEAARRGHRVLIITGGEPMMWQSNGWQLRDVIERARVLGFLDVAVFTNGTFPLQIPDCQFIVSIDGPKEKHNAIRPDTYDTILRNVREAPTSCIASITVTRANESELEQTVESIVATGFFKAITFNLLTSYPDVVERHGLAGEKRVEVLDRLWRMKQRGAPLVLSRAAWQALRKNNWKRPIRQTELFAGGEWFTCCRDVGRPEICRECGYSSCVEISQALSAKPSALRELWKASRV